MTIIDNARATINATLGAKERPDHAIQRDMADLVPAFRARVLSVLADMIAQGWDPMVWEAYRTPARAEMLAAKGVGVAKSMHCYGCAVDIICRKDRWKAPRGFWLALRKAAEAHGLVSGAAWRRVDLPHIQAVPVSMQAKVRSSHVAEIELMVARLLPPEGLVA